MSSFIFFKNTLMNMAIKKEKTISPIFKINIKKAKKWFRLPNQIFLWYLFFVLFGALLLSIPGVVHKTGVISDDSTHHITVTYGWNYLLALFNASSAFSDTGLSIPNAANDYSFWGQLIIVLLMEIGGFGVLTFKIMIFILLGRKLKLKDMILVQEERGSNEFGATIKIIKQSFYFLFFIQLIAIILLFFAFYFSPTKSSLSNHLNAYHNFSQAIWGAVFHGISAINNAGFDIVGKNSLQPYVNNYWIQFILIIEFIIGGLGFPVFYDLTKNRFGFKKDRHLTLFTKLNLITYLALSLFSVGLVSAIEFGVGNGSAVLNSQGHGFNGFMAIMFNTLSTRNAGFSSVNTTTFLSGSKWIQALMMFIGSSPSSTAGGIRTTTLAVLCIATWHTFRGRKTYTSFKRTIDPKIVNRSGIILIISLLMVLLVTILIAGTNPNLNGLDIFYTVCSAFGTVGLNNIPPIAMYRLGVVSLLALILLMFIGQLGVNGTLMIWGGKSPRQEWEYAREDIRVG